MEIPLQGIDTLISQQSHSKIRCFLFSTNTLKQQHAVHRPFLKCTPSFLSAYLFFILFYFISTVLLPSPHSQIPTAKSIPRSDAMKPSKPNKKRGKKKRKPSSPSPPQIQIQTASNAPQIEELAAAAEEEEDEERRALDLKWLVGAFSSLALNQIVSAYDETGGDPFKAAGVLGSQLVDPGEAAAAAEEEEEIKEIEQEKKKKKKKGAEERKQKKVAASSGIVANVIGKGYVKPSSHCGEGTRETDKSRLYGMEEGEEFLCSMLGDYSELGMGVVKDVLGQCGYDVEKALDALLDISACSFNHLMEKSDGNYSCTYPELSSWGLPESTDKTSDLMYHPSEKENDILQYVGYGCRDDTRCIANSEQPPTMSRVVNPDLQQKVLESLFHIPDSSIHEPNAMNWKKVVQQVESFGQGLEYRNGSITEPLLNARTGREDEYQVCRSNARKHWDTMKTYYQKAALAYSRGERAHAAQLSETGRIHGSLARKADEKASREIFEARNKDIKNTVTIDLHGQHVKQGIGLLKLHLLLFTYIPSVQFLKVITGYGGDSTTGRGRLKHSVIALVKKEGIEWCEENSGTVLLRLDGLKEYSFTEDDNDSDDSVY